MASPGRCAHFRRPRDRRPSGNGRSASSGSPGDANASPAGLGRLTPAFAWYAPVLTLCSIRCGGGSCGLSGETSSHPRGPQGASGRYAHFRRPRDRRPTGNDLSLSGETSSHPRGLQQAVPGLRTFHSPAGDRRLRGTALRRRDQLAAVICPRRFGAFRALCAFHFAFARGDRDGRIRASSNPRLPAQCAVLPPGANLYFRQGFA